MPPLSVFFALALAPASALPEKVEFNRHVRPILSDACFACHGPDKNARKADLRLDVREDAVAVRDGRRAIVPGDPGASELMRRLVTADADEVMPPPESHKSLGEAQISLLRRWIEQGAAYEQHWSYLQPARPAVNAAGPAAIDEMVARDLAAQHPGWTATPPAPPAVAVRRVFLDLTGLPPTPADVAAFSADPSDGAWAALVDRLLASPRFGERMAVPWLDLVRYADTVGFHGDQETSVSPYRDWVIRALNANKRYDVFTREQLAGDLLAADLPDGPEKTALLVASGYNRLNMTTEEGGSQPKEFLAKYMADRVRTTSTVWLAATMGCAQCHDHKFDPLTMRDFYALGAFFADVEEVGVYGGNGKRPPDMLVPTPADEARLGELRRDIPEAEKALQEANPPTLAAGQAEWLAKTRTALADRTPADAPWVDDEPPPGAALSGAWTVVDSPVHSGTKARRQEATGMVQHFFNRAAAPRTLGAGDAFYVWVKFDASTAPRTLMLQVHSAGKDTWNHRAFWGEDRISYGQTGTPTKHRAGDLPPAGEWARLEVSAAALGFAPGDVVDGFSFDQFGGTVFWDDAGLRTDAAAAMEATLPADVLAAVKAGNNSDPALARHWRTLAPDLAPWREKLAALQAEKAAIEARGTRTLITRAVAPRPVRVLPRGNWMDDSGALVTPAVPVVFQPKTAPKQPAAKAPTRLDLADWLVSRDNPLTARVAVNRLWKLCFGTGLSQQLDELGSQGDWPQHPELLDWLAVEFMDSEWDVKHVLRTIVLSRTYRQDSTLTPAQVAAGQTEEADPANRALGRQSRFRLDAEFLRDSALAVSGLLVEQTGGLPARPYQPAGYYAQLNFPTREYQPHADANQWRRGVYMHWQRTFLHPMLLAFDAPSRDECTANRDRSNTPLQALVTLNDPTFVEAARALAVRAVREGGLTAPARLDWAFTQALGRAPTAEQLGVLVGLHARESERFAAQPAAAAEFLKVGLQPPPADVPAAELAALTSTTRAVLSLHSFLTRP